MSNHYSSLGFPVYVKFFGKKGHQSYFEYDLVKPPLSVKDKTEFLQASGYLPKSLKRLLFSRLLSPNDYILCPLYYDKNEKPIMFQIGVTGGIESGENEYGAAARELGEEIGIIPEHIESSYIKRLDDLSYKKPIVSFLLPLKDSCLLTPSEQDKNMHPHSIETPIPYPFKKVGILVFGTQQEVLNILSKSFYRFKSEDNIFGLVAVRVKILRFFAQTISYSS